MDHFLNEQTPEPHKQWESPFEKFLHPTGNGSFVHSAEPVFGTPLQDSIAWPGKQCESDTCAIRCQEFVIEQFTGHDIDENALINEAQQHGWYTPSVEGVGGGTPANNVGNLLELHGIPVNRYMEANVFHLANELAQGHKVLVGVDANELWQGHPLVNQILEKLGFEELTPNHAVIVSGIDTSDPNHIRVIIHDPGTDEAVGLYSLEQFVDAWRDSNFFVVATKDPAPPHLVEMAHFDYSQGHIDHIGGLDYSHFLEHSNTHSAFEDYLSHFFDLHRHTDAGTFPLSDNDHEIHMPYVTGNETHDDYYFHRDINSHNDDDLSSWHHHQR